MTSLIYDKRHFELSTGDVIMNITVLFSLRFAVYKVITFNIIFQAFFCF